MNSIILWARAQHPTTKQIAAIVGAIGTVLLANNPNLCTPDQAKTIEGAVISLCVIFEAGKVPPAS